MDCSCDKTQQDHQKQSKAGTISCGVPFYQGGLWVGCHGNGGIKILKPPVLLIAMF